MNVKVMPSVFAWCAVFLLAGLFLLASLAQAAVETEVVSGDTASGENEPGWLFNRDTSTQSPFEFNLSASSTGIGSLFVEPITNSINLIDGNKDKFIAELFLLEDVADIESISYDFMIDSGDEEMFYMSVYANFATSSPTKFYDCRYNIVPSSGSDSAFTTVTFSATTSYPVVTRTGGEASPFTCPATLAEMDDVAYEGPGATIRAISLNVGDTSGSDLGTSGYLDNVVVTMADGDIEAYDFDPDASTLVSNSEGEYYMTIQDAIDGTDAGGTVNVPEGTYEENLSVLKGISIVGAGSGDTIIDPASGTAVTIPAWSLPQPAHGTVDGFTLEGFTLGGDIAFLAGSGTPDDTYYNSNLTLRDIEVVGNAMGIFLMSVQGATLEDVHLEGMIDGSKGALELAGVAQLEVSDSMFIDNPVAVRLLATDSGPAQGYGANGPISIDSSLFMNNGVDIDNQDASTTIATSSNQVGVTYPSTTEATSTPQGTVEMEIPSNTVVVGPEGWDGIVNAPAVVSTPVDPTPDDGFSATSILSIEVGSPDTALIFDKGVRLVFENQAGNFVGWSRNGVFTAIADVCNNDSQTTGNNLADGADCKIDSGDDLVVWTKHFTTFTTYSQTANSSGGGGSTIRPVTALGTVAGEVLGAMDISFNVNLTVGSRGDDVTSLQEVLIAKGYLQISAPTGYFGPLTLAAVKAYQAAHGVPATGFVGPLTRAVLNGVTATVNAPAVTTPALTAEQADALIELLETFDADADTILKVKASLGY